MLDSPTKQYHHLLDSNANNNTNKKNENRIAAGGVNLTKEMKSGLKESIRYAIGCLSNIATNAKCSSLIARTGGLYAAVQAFKVHAHRKKDYYAFKYALTSILNLAQESLYNNYVLGKHFFVFLKQSVFFRGDDYFVFFACA